MNDIANKVDWQKTGGLVPAVVQDSATARVLMLGYMNREALEQTLASGKVTFFSRSKNRLWTKGETSGNFLFLKDIAIDCDNDTLLVAARAAGPACHNGTETCFGKAHPKDLGFLGVLEEVIAERAKSDPEKSYVAKLFSKGLEKIAQKVGEEGVETALAGVSTSEENLKNEAADLVFHLMILLKAKNLSLRDIAAVLESRHQER
jgi:phosphoribosyl-ATP pyrophosphohydrolase/phosphoribosyl-AMP cyclohydrolase